MKPLKRVVINTIIYLVVYLGVTAAMKHEIDWGILIVSTGVYFAVGLVVFTILDKVSKE